MIAIEERLRAFDHTDIHTINQDNICCICMSAKTNSQLKCGHSFCRLCVMKIYRTQFQNSLNNEECNIGCPLCRKTMLPAKPPTPMINVVSCPKVVSPI